MLIGEDLYFDVARTLDVLLDVHRVVAKRILRFALSRAQCVFDFGVGARIVRLHVGLEATGDLIDDLTRALAAAKT